MQQPPPPNEQDKPEDSQDGVFHIDAKALDQITPEMLRAVEDSAMDKMVHQIAEEAGVSIHCINRRLAKARRLLKTYSTLGAYRLLLLARKLDLK